jgi:hypothetical protein
MGAIDQIGLNHLMILLIHAGQNALKEGWQDATPPGIDANIWAETLTGTGGRARDLTEAPYIKQLLTGPANADTARLRSIHQWSCGPTVWGTNHIYKRFVFVWEGKFTTVASIDNTFFFMGLAPTTVATRATNELIGFILTADALNSLTDDGGVETVNAVGAPVLTNWHLYALEVYAGGVVFYIDGAAVAQHTTNLPDQAFYLTWYLPQEAAANGGQLHIGSLGCFYEFVVR